MAKKRHRDTQTVNAPEPTPIASEAATAPPPPESESPTAAPAAPSLLDEVQSFLAQREELAKKLAEEIAATEQKLVELKKTAAQLFPETAAAAAPKDKKAKKVSKPKPAPREPEPTVTVELPSDAAS